jgi:anaerobic selenocysteine-containing dehydrogenase
MLRPLGEAVAWGDILIHVAQRIGGKMQEFFTFDSVEDFLKKILGQFEELESLGGLNYLKKHGIWVPSVGKTNYKVYRRKGFKTVSGKFEVYSSRLKALGFSPLPSYEAVTPPTEEEFVLVTFSPNVHTLRTSNSKWLAETSHENPVWINKEVGRWAVRWVSGREMKSRSCHELAQLLARFTLLQASIPKWWALPMALAIGNMGM